jgi:predicted acyltransferase
MLAHLLLPSPSESPAAAARPQNEREPRLRALDVHRGSIVAAMIFVNYLGTLPRIPALLLHADERPDTITLPDLVFPGFLLIVGMALPLSFQAAERARVPLGRTLLHIAARTTGLVLAGVGLEFSSTLVAENTGLSYVQWILLFHVGLILVWQRYSPALAARFPHLPTLARGSGLLLLGALLGAFRGPASPHGGFEWLHHEWWGILGIIGYSYGFCSLLYLALRGRPLALASAVGAMLALYIGSRHGLGFLNPEVNGFADLGALFGSSSANVMLGALAGSCFVESKAPTQRLRFLLGLAVVAVVCGFLLRPLHGFSKNNATESFTLVTGGLQLALFSGIYWLVDVAGVARWAEPFARVGQNALLAYLLPDLCDYLAELLHLKALAHAWLWPWAEATLPAQLANTCVATALILALCLLLTRAGLRLRL